MPIVERQQEEEQTTFYLQGFAEEKQMCSQLAETASVEEIKDHMLNHINIHTLLECPIGVTYFHKFLSSEMNVENLQCYLDLKALLDYIKHAKRCPLFDLAKINDLEEVVIEKMENEYPEEYEQDFLSNVPQMEEESVTSSQQKEATETQRIVRDDTALDPERMKRYGADVMKKSANFINKYLSESAASEVNIDNATRRDVKESFTTVTEKSQQLNEVKDAIIKEKGSEEAVMTSEVVLMKASELKEAVVDVELNLEKLKNALLANLSDPLSRFKHSAYVDECVTLFLTSANNTNFHRDRLLSANKGGVILNMDVPFPENAQARSPLTVVREILTQFKVLLSSEDIWEWDHDYSILKLNFEKLAKHRQLKKVYDMTSELSKVELNALESDAEKIAFWINTFNIMMLHAVLIAEGIPLIEISRQLFYRKTKYLIDGHEFSLEDIREGILFGNRCKNLVLGKQFKKNDVRKQFMVSKPIINTMFALTCYTLQSVNVEIIDADTVYEQLDRLTTIQVDKLVKLDTESKHVVTAPSMWIEKKDWFKLFADDPDAVTKSATETVINFVKRYATHFKQEENKQDLVIFRDNFILVNNFAVVLSEKDRTLLEKKKRASAPAKVQPKKVQETTVADPVKEKKCCTSWPTPKNIHASFKRLSLKRKQRKAAALQTNVPDQKKCLVM